MLGRPHRLVGRVVGGQQRGRTLGFPTANLNDIPQLIPAAGVYAAIAQTADDALHLAAVNIGPQPTFDQSSSRVEAHLLGFEGELGGAALGLHLLIRLRDQQRFESPTDLAGQLERDTARVRKLTAQRDELAATPPIPLLTG